MAAEFKSTVEQAVADNKIAGGAGIAVDKTGKIIISHAFGKTAVDESGKPFQLDTTAWLASSSKLLTAISALQAVEKGLLKLDEDVGVHMSDWKSPQILKGYSDDGKPEYVPAKNKITLRRLLTHSSGMPYEFMNPVITRYRKELGAEPTGSIEDQRNPLAWEPGTSWEYGTGIDWAGHLLEVVSGMKLGEWEKKYIWDVLGMDLTTFDPVGNEAIMSRLTGRVGRDETGKLGKEESPQYAVENKKDHFGGHGLYSCAQDYIKVVTSLLLNDGKLLGPEMYEELFRPQLENPQAFKQNATHPVMGAFLAPAYGGVRGEESEWDYACGGAVVQKEIPGLASKGTLFWSGLPNNYWWVDKASGVAGYYASWLLPPGDAVTGQMFQALQRAAVKEVAKL